MIDRMQRRKGVKREWLNAEKRKTRQSGFLLDGASGRMIRRQRLTLRAVAKATLSSPRTLSFYHPHDDFSSRYGRLNMVHPGGFEPP
ncbi:hypothetical protein ACUTRI_24110, partial [Serratia sp. TSA_130.2]|uniref:hypothetical protein n=1 Tax=Serratia sp. TSA_130.2 TaxID=3415662 RepID=UPI004045B02A